VSGSGYWVLDIPPTGENLRLATRVNRIKSIENPWIFDAFLDVIMSIGRRTATLNLRPEQKN
ncbi:MAG: hypothetical protein KAR17_16320, partial [Cyclobacteriaceae bacterium]|nr:hypothetical protein [Cyclobacteriaceae bacterium]